MIRWQLASDTRLHCIAIFFFSDIFRSTNTKFWAESLQFWGKFRGKIELSSTQNLLCRKFAASCLSVNFFPHLHQFLQPMHEAASVQSAAAAVLVNGYLTTEPS